MPTKQHEVSSPEKKYPAENEDVDTIITGSDGKDYIVDVIDGFKKWTLYLPEPNDEIIIQKVLPCLKDISDVKPMVISKGPNKYQVFMSEMTKTLKTEQPNLTSVERKEIISKLWEEEKKKKTK